MCHDATVTSGGLDDARAAVERGEWGAAAAALDRVVADGGVADAIDAAAVWELRAVACYGAGDLEGSVAAWEEGTGERATTTGRLLTMCKA